MSRSEPAIKILIVDEYPVVRAGLRAMLKAPGIRVVGEAAARREVLRLVRTRSPDLVLMDGSGDGDSIDLLRRIKQQRPRTSVVFLTTREGMVDLSRAIALGCSGYLRRKIERPELLQAVRAIARGECILDPTLLREHLKHVAVRRDVEPAERLTVPEREVVRLIARGETNRQIAERLRYSLGTVKDLVQRIIRKLGVSDRTQAAVKALQLELID